MRLRGLLFEAMLRQEIGWYDDPANGTGTLCSKLSTDASAVQGAIGQRIGTIVQSCSTIIFSIALAIYYEWRLGLVGMAFIPIIMFVTYIQGLLIRKETLNYHNSLGSSTKVSLLLTSLLKEFPSKRPTQGLRIFLNISCGLHHSDYLSRLKICKFYQNIFYQKIAQLRIFISTRCIPEFCTNKLVLFGRKLFIAIKCR
jgi:hypothetical protein